MPDGPEAHALRSARYDWGALCARAQAALLAECQRSGELPARRVAALVARAIPKPLGKLLLRGMFRQGWLGSAARVPFDVLDRPDCPRVFRGPVRELARLALFGIPGQGISYRDKHREDVYQQLCAEIMSSAVDESSLHSIAARALNHPDVCADPVLGSMIQSFIAQREASLRVGRTPAEKHADHEQTSKLRHAFDAGPRFPTREELLVNFARLQRDFDAYLSQFEENRAQFVLDKMRLLRQRFPVHIPAADLQRCEEQYDRLSKRAGTYRRQIRELAEQGRQAAASGDDATAAWVIRRLQAINMLLPTLLPVPELDRLRDEISRSSATHDSEEASREMRERQRAVVQKIKELAGIIHRFHELAAKLPPEHNAYRRAEVNYRRAVEEIRRLDTEWLTGLVLQLETLLDDLDDPGGEMQSQLDRFIGNVRTALNRLCLEIRSWQAKRGPSASAPPGRPDQADPSPPA